MSLPAGFKELTYIEAHGDQYIDTGIVHASAASSKLRFIFDFEPDEGSSGTTQYIFGTRTGVAVQSYNMFWLAAGNFRIDYYNIQFAPTTEYSGQHTLDWNLVTADLDGSSKKFTAYKLTNTYPIYLGSINQAGTAGHLLADGQTGFIGKIYSCQIYRSDVLERDFVPCMTAAGAVGLYDKVEGVFHPNIGTQSFTAGEALPHAPDPVSDLTVSSGTGSVYINWSADENALGYRIYRNGELIADIAETSYSEDGLEVYIPYEYTIVPYNDLGDGLSTTVTAVIKGSVYLPDDLITDRTAADTAAKNAKGTYNASDFNRVSAAAGFVRSLLAPLGYSTPEIYSRAWALNEIPAKSEIAAHHASVIGQDVINYAVPKSALPDSLANLTYEGANNIEKFLLLCAQAAERIPEGYIYSGETEAE